MSLVAPLWLAAAGIVGAGVLIAHLFSRTVPPQDMLPTVRFVPESTPLTVMRSRRVTEWLLLVLRLVVVALLGLALSGAHLERPVPSTIVLIDASRAVASMRTSIDSALAVSAPDAEFIVFDSTARRVTRAEVGGLRGTTVRASLSAALVAAHRVAANAKARAWPQLVIVSPAVREEVDTVTQPLLDLWRGPIRVIRVQATAMPARAVVDVRASGDDPVAAALAGVVRGGAATVRLLRVPASRADSLWAESGGALVVWPADGRSLPRLSSPDTQGAIVAGQSAVVASFVRVAQPREGKAVVRWMNGDPAASERPLGRGCVRDVAIPVDAVGDLALRESFREVARGLTQPCGGAPDFRGAEVPKVDDRDFGEVGRAQSMELPMPDAGRLPLLLALAAATALGVEQVIRRRARQVA